MLSQRKGEEAIYTLSGPFTISVGYRLSNLPPGLIDWLTSCHNLGSTILQKHLPLVKPASLTPVAMNTDRALRIMYLLPAWCDDQVIKAYAEMVELHKLPNTEVEVSSLPNTDGALNHIEYNTYEAIMSRGIIRATRQAAQRNFDAMVVACFYDTALQAAREISSTMVVTAPCIAACEIAASLGNRWGIIVGRPKWVYQMRQTVFQYGFRDNLTGFYTVDLGVHDFLADEQETERRLVQAGRRAIEQDHAEVIILGCTMQLGFYNKLSRILGVPVIDVAVAALKRAEFAAILKHQCGWIPSRVWSCEAPSEKELKESRVFENEQVFGNSVIVRGKRMT